VRNGYEIFAGKHPLQRLGRWEDNINMHLRDVGYEIGRWMEVAEDGVQRQALVSGILNPQVLL
jgi:hypothetical protein